jgi:hypothetical protein
MQWIYTGGAIDYYAYPGQFFDMFPKLSPCDLLRIEHLPQTDHLASLRADREQVLRLVSNWCVERVGLCAPRASTAPSAPAPLLAPGILTAPTAHLCECG